MVHYAAQIKQLGLRESVDLWTRSHPSWAHVITDSIICICAVFMFMYPARKTCVINTSLVHASSLMRNCYEDCCAPILLSSPSSLLFIPVLMVKRVLHQCLLPGESILYEATREIVYWILSLSCQRDSILKVILITWTSRIFIILYSLIVGKINQEIQMEVLFLIRSINSFLNLNFWRLSPRGFEIRTHKLYSDIHVPY